MAFPTLRADSARDNPVPDKLAAVLCEIRLHQIILRHHLGEYRRLTGRAFVMETRS